MRAALGSPRFPGANIRACRMCRAQHSRTAYSRVVGKRSAIPSCALTNDRRWFKGAPDCLRALSPRVSIGVRSETQNSRATRARSVLFPQMATTVSLGDVEIGQLASVIPPIAFALRAATCSLQAVQSGSRRSPACADRASPRCASFCGSRNENRSLGLVCSVCGIFCRSAHGCTSQIAHDVVGHDVAI
jgi:hypothetical protein